MIRVLIIDDEPIVRQGLKLIIPWKENGFEICSESSDFDDGLEKIKDLNPDIVLTDIKMPGGFGTDLIKKSIEQGFKGKFIIISGYSNFEYAKTAIKYGVKSYILKPIDEDELLEILLSIKENILRDKNDKSISSVIKKAQVERYILGLEKNIDKYYYDFDELQLALIYSNGILLDKMNEFINSNIDKENIEVLELEGNIALLFINMNYEHIKNILRYLYKKIEDDFKKSVFIAISKTIYSLGGLQGSYKNLREIVNQRFLFMENKIMDEKTLSVVTEKFEDNFEIDTFAICSYVEVCDMDKLKSEFEKIEREVREKIYSKEKIRIGFINMYSEIKRKLSTDYNLNEYEFKSNSVFADEIYKRESLNQTIEYLINEFKSISNKINESSSENIIKKVINYMNKNYDKDIKLEVIGEIFNYNSAYLGKLFKSSTKESFNTYLDKIRIKKAKELLLKKGLKVYQVSEKVGYKNIDYFHSKFKKYVGISPMKYKRENKD